MKEKLREKIVIEITVLNVILTTVVQAIIVLLIIFVLLNPNIIYQINKYYNELLINLDYWYKPWLILVPTFILLGFLVGCINVCVLLIRKEGFENKKRNIILKESILKTKNIIDKVEKKIKLEKKLTKKPVATKNKRKPTQTKVSIKQNVKKRQKKK